ncbi:hypothetical protein F4813DRAFT_189105 [Daldinia decipiens]|uniref:uncharacterized protein n=1 Tax=Daldinia decipiens TaxID=326647 RepID=UPI0020C35744|nr:uncharacterized protein F4813DRAFT_189105 [Daldinia decipiens]KAI1655082.1 hypothetical protein F4813DRAFT_189105 [Daldinia decipiens]
MDYVTACLHVAVILPLAIRAAKKITLPPSMEVSWGSFYLLTIASISRSRLEILPVAVFVAQTRGGAKRLGQTHRDATARHGAQNNKHAGYRYDARCTMHDSIEVRRS